MCISKDICIKKYNFNIILSMLLIQRKVDGVQDREQKGKFWGKPCLHDDCNADDNYNDIDSTLLRMIFGNINC